MSDINLDGNGDLALTGNSLALTTGKDAIAQNLLIRLLHFRGEWFRDTTTGIPYYRDVLVKNPSESLLRQIFTEAITETPGIASLDSLTFTFDKAARSLTMSFVCTTQDGDVLEFTELRVGDA